MSKLAMFLILDPDIDPYGFRSQRVEMSHLEVNDLIGTLITIYGDKCLVDEKGEEVKPIGIWGLTSRLENLEVFLDSYDKRVNGVSTDDSGSGSDLLS